MGRQHRAAAQGSDPAQHPGDSNLRRHGDEYSKRSDRQTFPIHSESEDDRGMLRLF